MNILIINHYATPPSQPGGTRHFSLAKALMARGHQVTLAASSFDHLTRTHRLKPGERIRRETLEGVPFLWLATPAYAGNGAGRLLNMLVFARAVRRLEPEALGGRPDVVVGSSPHLFGAKAALRLARRAGVPFVLEIRDVWPQSLIDVMDVPPWHPLIWVMERVERELYREADHIITLLPAVAARVAERGGGSKTITWVSNGIDLALVPAVGPPRERPAFVFMYAGSHGVTNALDVVLDAARLLQARDRERPGPVRRAQVVMVGTGPEKPRLEARARKEGLQNLTFLPPVPKREIYELLAQADAFVVSSRDSSLWQHGISFNKIFDFMAMARPAVVGLRSPNNPIAEAGSGLIVAPGDAAAMAEAMASLMEAGPEACRAMGQRGRAHVEAHFDFRVLAQRFEGALLEAQAARPRRIHAS
jgi:glycosyltransferase involved in cell wall biosynthesis